MEVQGKVALVTGASRGVGRATSIALAERGCAVAVNYSVSADQAEEVAQEIRDSGGRAITVQADVSKNDEVTAMMDKVIAEFGGLDILVNNAGTTSFIAHGDLDSVTDEVWDRILGVNVKGAFNCIRAARPHLDKSGSAEIVNIASVAGVAALGSSVPYCASKAALINMGVSLGWALGPSIRINTVAPGFIQGKWLEQGLGEAYQQALKANERRAVLGKVCTPEDVEAAILSFITGSDMVNAQTDVCEGGMLIGPQLWSQLCEE